MGIQIADTKGLSQNSLVLKLVDNVCLNPTVFRYLSRIFSVYKRNDEMPISDIFSYIDRELNGPKLKMNVDEATIKELIKTMKKVYQLNQRKFSDVRGEILENVVYNFGPATVNLEREKVYIEPIITDNGTTIGTSDKKCDFVFFQSDTMPMEFTECKANIANIIPRSLPFEMTKKDHKNKIEYLDNAYKYLKENYCKPFIYFACYNLNYNIELNNLQNNWGFSNMNFINAEEIIQGKHSQYGPNA